MKVKHLHVVFTMKRVMAILIIIALVFVHNSNSFAQLPGDANGDGIITSADITCVILAIFGEPCFNPDCNGDGLATSADITCGILAIFGIPPPPPPPPPVCPLGTVSCPGAGDGCINEVDVCCGDGTSCPEDFEVCTGIPGICCPTGFLVLCADNENCATDPAFCPSGCPSGQKDCRGDCIPESSQCCPVAGVCPSDSQCTGIIGICCPTGFPFLCADNENCATDLSFCPSGCPTGQKECSGVGCIPNSAECCGGGGFCADPNFPHCVSGGCCPAGFPLLCPDNMTCVADLSFCPSGCPSGQKECPAGGCALESSTCCANGGSCRSDVPVCVGTSGCCPTAFPIGCPDNITCVTDLSLCP